MNLKRVIALFFLGNRVSSIFFSPLVIFYQNRRNRCGTVWRPLNTTYCMRDQIGLLIYVDGGHRRNAAAHACFCFHALRVCLICRRDALRCAARMCICL
ncbi:hypothetical protein BC828DRAFT_375636 [Blastocladiella britannica]|nr:hypothetical protein BC828DRAFT_375636 [Blastocladiella britannica]